MLYHWATQEHLNTLKYTQVLNTLLNDIMFLLQFIVEI